MHRPLAVPGPSTTLLHAASTQKLATLCPSCSGPQLGKPSLCTRTLEVREQGQGRETGPRVLWAPISPAAAPASPGPLTSSLQFHSTLRKIKDIIQVSPTAEFIFQQEPHLLVK